MTKPLNIYWGTILVGKLWLNDKRSFVFQYDDIWVTKKGHPLSLLLPIQKKPFSDDASKPFFSNLLPEARIRTLIAGKLGISDKNDFKLLEELGGECAGAISLIAEGEMPEIKGAYKPLSSQNLDKMIKEMPRKPMLAAKEGMRLSLAGAQNKLPVYVKDGLIYLPEGNFSSSHILKPKIPEFEDTVENEAFCMMLAKKCGLPVPKISILQGKYSSCLVERYDRETKPDGSIVRLHQEDFCQALGYGYDQKYESEGGPNLKDCFSLLEKHSTNPIIDKRNMLQWVVFNYLIGNCDAHAKNISILFTEGKVKLAPFYDLMSTIIYPELNSKMAMKVGGENRLDWIMRRHWERLAMAADVGEKAIIGICKKMGETALKETEILVKTFEKNNEANKTILKIRKHILKRSDILRVI